MSRAVVSDDECFTAQRMVGLRVVTHLSTIASATNIRVAFRSSAPVETSRSPWIWANRNRRVCGLRLAERRSMSAPSIRNR